MVKINAVDVDVLRVCVWFIWFLPFLAYDNNVEWWCLVVGIANGSIIQCTSKYAHTRRARRRSSPSPSTSSSSGSSPLPTRSIIPTSPSRRRRIPTPPAAAAVPCILPSTLHTHPTKHHELIREWQYRSKRIRQPKPKLQSKPIFVRPGWYWCRSWGSGRATRGVRVHPWGSKGDDHTRYFDDAGADRTVAASGASEYRTIGGWISGLILYT